MAKKQDKRKGNGGAGGSEPKPTNEKDPDSPEEFIPPVPTMLPPGLGIPFVPPMI
jgi:hypothetical protein